MTTTEPWGQTPLTTEGLASLGHPLSLGDFNQDADGRYWRVIRGAKTYYPREWFDRAGTFTGTGTQPGDRAGQDEGFFHRGTKWNWETGQWENPTNWANVVGTLAAGGVGAGIAAPFIAGAVGGGAAGAGGASGASGGLGSSLAGSATAGITHGGATALLTNPLVTGGIKNIVDVAQGKWTPADLAALIPTGTIAGAVTNNPYARAALTSGLNTGVRAATTGKFDPAQAALDLGTSLVGPTARSATANPLAQRALTAGGTTAINTARGKPLTPIGVGTTALNVLAPGPTRRSTGVMSFSGDDSGGGNAPANYSRVQPTGGDDVSTLNRWQPLNWSDPDGPEYPWDDQLDVEPDGDTGDGGDDIYGPPDPGPRDPVYGPPDPGPPDDVYGPPDPGPRDPVYGPPDPGPRDPSGTVPNPSPGGGGGGRAPTQQDDLYTKLLKALEGGGGSNIAGLLTQGLGGFLSGLGQSMFQQKRQSFKGTAADPTAVMGDLGTGLKNLLGGFQGRLDAGVSLPDAYVSSQSPVFTGGGMAMPVGVLPSSDDVGLDTPVSLDAKGIVRRDPASTQGLQPGMGPAADVLPLFNAPRSGAAGDDRQRALSALSLLGVGGS